MNKTTECPKCKNKSILVIKSIIICNQCGYSNQNVVITDTSIDDLNLDELSNELNIENQIIWKKLFNG